MMQKAADRNAVNRLYVITWKGDYQLFNVQKRTLQDNSVKFRTFSSLTEETACDNLSLFRGRHSFSVGYVDHIPVGVGSTCRIFLLSGVSITQTAVELNEVSQYLEYFSGM